MSNEVKPAKLKNCLTEGKQIGLIADLPQSWHSTVFTLLASRVPVLIYWGLARVKFYHISICSDGLSQVCQFKPDIIFINLLVRRVINRFTATQKMRLLPKFKGVTTIALAARIFDFEQQSRLASDHGFLSKLVGKTDLLEKLQWHLKLEWVEQEQIISRVTSPAQKVSGAIVSALSGIEQVPNERQWLIIKGCQLHPFCQLSKSFQAQQILEFVN